MKCEVYTDADEIHFILNGDKKAVVKPETGIAYADILYEKGELVAVSYKNGQEVKKSALKTVGDACKIKINPEKTEFFADNRDLCYFEIFIQDSDGNRVPNAKNELVCECEGGELLCIFSGDPANEDQYGSDKCHAFEGRAIAVVRAKEKKEITVRVLSDGLVPDSVVVNSVC